MNDAVPEDRDQDAGGWEDVDEMVATTNHLDTSQAPLSDQAAVELEADKWANLWNENNTYSEPDFEMEEGLKTWEG